MNLMEQQFRKLYFGEVAYPGEPGMVFTYEAKPDAAIQSYDKAIRISIWADKLVQHSDHWYRVELLDKRAAEMRDLVEAIVKAVDDGGQRKVMIQKILNGTLPPSSRDVDVKRLKAIADQLNIRDSGLLGEILATCKDKDAVRAAKAGVTLWRGV